MSSNVFSFMVSALTNVVSDKITQRALKKDDVLKLIRDNIDGHRKMHYALNSHGDKELTDWFREKVRPAMKTSQHKSIGCYDKFVSKLSGKARDMERKRPFGSLLQANKDMEEVLSDIASKIDTLMANDEATIFDTRMTTFGMLGILKKSDKLLNYSIFLFSMYSRLASRSATSIPRYRDDFLLENTEAVAKLTSEICDKSGPWLFLKESDTVRKRQADLVLGAGGVFSFIDYANVRSYPSSFLDNLFTALSCLNFYSAAMDAWEEYQLNKHERNKETKEWLEHHVALLRMDLEDMDRSSPEYQKQLDIIKAYDATITDYDKEINEFEGR